MICLSRADLLEISGFRRPTSIATWLRQNGFVFVVAADRWPRVDAQHYHASIKMTEDYIKQRSTDTVQPHRRK